MTLVSGLAIYFVIWWLVLFTTLPFGVKSQADGGGFAKGTEPGAPQQPFMIRKMLATTIIAGVIFAIIYYLRTVHDLGFEDIPILTNL